MEAILFWVLMYFVFKKIKEKKKLNKKPAVERKRTEPSSANPDLYDLLRQATRTLENVKRSSSPTVKSTPAAAMHDHEHAEGESCPPPAFHGSMQVESTEGECLCEPILEHDRIVEPESVYAGEIGREPLLDFSAKGLYQGIVMSEVLKRPAQRWRR